MTESQEKRESTRTRLKYEGFSVFNGELLEIKVRDTNERGVGLFSTRALRPGEEGVLFARLPDHDQIEQMPISVLWCIPDPESAHPSYPFRAGARFLETD